MTLRGCIKKTFCGANRDHFIAGLVVTWLLLISNFVALRPWDKLPLAAFVYVQCSLLAIMLILQIAEISCHSLGVEKPKIALHASHYFLAILFVTATVDGFICKGTHADVNQPTTTSHENT